MADVNTIAFQEDFILWAQLSVEEDKLGVNRAVSESLPVSINHETIYQPQTVDAIAKGLVKIAEKNHLARGKVRFSIPGRFALIKKVHIDRDIDPQHYPEIVAYNLEKTWSEPRQNYSLFLPEYSQSVGRYREVLAVAIQNQVLEFFDRVAEKAALELESLTPNCFNVDQLFRRATPEFEEPALLLGWQRRGYEIIISDKKDLLYCTFRPYDMNLQPIEQIDDDELLSRFDALLEELRQPPNLETVLYDIKEIYFYGIHFKPEWLELLTAQVPLPMYLMNFDWSSNYSVNIQTQEINEKELYQFLEAVANIF